MQLNKATLFFNSSYLLIFCSMQNCALNQNHIFAKIMDSNTNLPQDATPSYEEQYLGKSPRCMWTRTKIIVAVFTMLGIAAAIVGVCAVVVVVAFPAEKNDGELHVMDLESNERLKSIVSQL